MRNRTLWLALSVSCSWSTCDSTVGLEQGARAGQVGCESRLQGDPFAGLQSEWVGMRACSGGRSTLCGRTNRRTKWPRETERWARRGT
eukprot:scaffold16579_cov130-Isochrysis_galbana.AAC.2